MYYLYIYIYVLFIYIYNIKWNLLCYVHNCICSLKYKNITNTIF